MIKDYIFIREKNILRKIRIADINFIKALGDYVTIFTSVKKYTVHITLKNIYDKLPKDIFYRCHRSYIVNMDKIISIEQLTITLENDFVLIGEDCKKELLQKINIINK